MPCSTLPNLTDGETDSERSNEHIVMDQALDSDPQWSLTLLKRFITVLSLEVLQVWQLCHM